MPLIVVTLTSIFKSAEKKYRKTNKVLLTVYSQSPGQNKLLGKGKNFSFFSFFLESYKNALILEDKPRMTTVIPRILPRDLSPLGIFLSPLASPVSISKIYSYINQSKCCMIEVPKKMRHFLHFCYFISNTGVTFR